jgi:hypothetical protein
MNKRETINLLNLLNAGETETIRALLEANLKELNTKDMIGNKFLTGIKAAKKELKKAAKTRPVLGYSHTANDIQYMTDTFWALALSKEYHTDLIEDHGNNYGAYPNLEEFIPQAANGERVTVTPDDIANAWQPSNGDKRKFVVLDYHESRVFLNADYCKMIMQIMGDGARWYTYGPHRPVLIESERGRAVIVPVRMPGKVEKEYNDHIKAQRAGA